ncbi:hypothetical protein [Aromatoleum evansii]|uniref:hypothetical protein n=1 Tax=Aromatoleum evansii TaxID=59406 RepID=UPI00145CE3B5|nr:hypothetical protein [Aromatoleum evansii]NMG28430.1 hypothetical protein [Aromatoleum evansii]
MKRAPLSARERAQLQRDAADVRATAQRKGLTLDAWEEREESAIAREHFELGCWLYWYQHQVYREGKDGLQARIECAERIFLAGFTNPKYKFFTVFDFGERQFDTIFEMGDSAQVLEGLRERLKKDKSGKIAEAFTYFGWPQTAPDLLAA